MDRVQELERLLLSHQPADELEREFVGRMRTLLEQSPDPFSRSRYAPGHFTASAFVLSPDARELLLIFHTKLERWLQPGGHVEPEDASILDAARREVREEVGIDEPETWGRGIFDVDIHDIPARKSEPGHQHFDVRFAFRAQHLEHTAGSDAAAARWVALADVCTLESDASVLRAVHKLRARGA